MATVRKGKGTEPLVLVGRHDGTTVISTPTRLTRLNYFDGRFMRAEHLRAEQQYHRDLVALANQAGGGGVVGGFDVTRASGDSLAIGGGLAYDAAGRTLYFPDGVTLDVQELIDRSARRVELDIGVRADEGDFGDCLVTTETPPDTVVEGASLYLITVGAAEALCGEEDVYGKLCEEACITSSDRPSIVEGVVFRARPLTLVSQFPSSKAVALSATHLRSRVASAYYADEWAAGGSLISRAGLQLETWCLGAPLASGSEVPLAVLARNGRTTAFVDAWIARRERMEPPPRRYWAGRMAMRSWPSFLAQVLQFQCELNELILAAPEPGALGDPCRPQHLILQDAREVLADVEDHYTRLIEAYRPREGSAPRRRISGADPFEELPLTKVASIRRRLQDSLSDVYTGPADRVLIRGGIVELPPAGYLPVVPGTGVTVNEQVRRLLGEGPDLAFCVVRPDYVAHALEEAQHMERISLLEGLDHPEAKPEVDVLVPNGRIAEEKATVAGVGWEIVLQLGPTLLAQFDAHADERLLELERRRAEAERNPAADRWYVEHGGTRPAAGMRRVTDLPSQLSLHGAARTERRRGGAAFYAAGATETQHAQRIGEIVRTWGNVGRTDLRHFRGVRTADEVDYAPYTPDDSAAMRIGGVAADADTMLELRGDSAFTERGATTDMPMETLDPETDAGRVASVWLKLTCDDDPFRLSPGESTAVTLRADLASPGKQDELVDGTLNGELTIEQNHGSVGSEHQVTARFDGPGSLTAIAAGEDQGGPSGTVRLRVTLTRATNDSGEQTLTAELLRSVGFGFIVTAQWSPDHPTKAMVEIEVARMKDAGGHALGDEMRGIYRMRDVRPAQRGTLLGIAHLKEESDVLRAGNTAHSLALSALRIVGLGLGDRTFADRAEQELFPPPAAPVSSLTVEATTDWVLFHRRRTKRCAEEQVPTVAPPRRFELWEGRAKTLDELERYRRILRSGSAAEVRRLGLARVGEVEFAGGLPTVKTPLDTLVLAWRAVQPGNRIDYAAIAAATGDAPTLDRERLTRLEQALASVSTTEAATIAESLPNVPEPLAVQGTDGVIVLVTRQASVATTCHTVFRIENIGRGLEQLVARIEKQGLPAFRKKNPTTLVELGTVEFAEDGTTPIGDTSTVQQAWGTGTPALAAVLSHKGDAAAGTKEMRSKRAASITSLLGNAVTAGDVVTAAELGVDCPAATIVFGREGGPAPTPDRVLCYTVRGAPAFDENELKNLRKLADDKDVTKLALLGDDLGELIHGQTGGVRPFGEASLDVKSRTLYVFAPDMRGFSPDDEAEIAKQLGWPEGGYTTEEQINAAFPASVTCPFFVFAVVRADLLIG